MGLIVGCRPRDEIELHLDRSLGVSIPFCIVVFHLDSIFIWHFRLVFLF